MEWLLLQAGEPFGCLLFTLDAGKLVNVSRVTGRERAARAPASWRRALREHLLGRRPFPVALSFEGISPFRVRVLRAAMEIPAGSVCTYGALAARAGHPGAARAVGSTMAANPFTLLVPCHRVVPKSGGVGRYGTPDGTRLKKRLLDWEKEACQGLGDD